MGGYVSAILPVTAGDTLYIFVGGYLGYNGGGAPTYAPSTSCVKGGGSSDVRSTSTDLDARLIVAGGGGAKSYKGYAGGVGGGLTGGTGATDPDYSGGNGGHGGSQTEGGTGTTGCPSSAGTLGLGGDGCYTGGGGGYYGGGGCYSGGGGGGSSFVINTGSLLENTQGDVRCTGHGMVYLTLLPQPTSNPTPLPTAPTPVPSVFPSGQPSRQPSRQPSDQPSTKPTSSPTNALETLLDFNVTQTLLCSSCATQFGTTGSTYQIAFKRAVAAQISGLATKNINIVSEASARRLLPSSLEDGRALSTSAVVIYRLAFTSSQVHLSVAKHATPATIYSAVTNSLQNSVSSGAFSAAIVAELPGQGRASLPRLWSLSDFRS